MPTIDLAAAVEPDGLTATVPIDAVGNGLVDVRLTLGAGVSDAQLRAASSLRTSLAGAYGLMHTAATGYVVTPGNAADLVRSGRILNARKAGPDLEIESAEALPAGVLWVTGAQIIDHAGGDSAAADPDDLAWADASAAAVSQGMNLKLAGVLVLTTGDYPELVAAARGAGVETYRRREAVFGLTGYVDLQGAAVRIARDPLEAIAPILARYATVGIA